VDSVKTESSDLDVKVAQVRGTLREGYMEWACLLQCADEDGCRAAVRATVHFESSGEPKEIVINGQLDAPQGGRTQLGRVQRPPVRVDDVDRVVIDVVGRRAPGDPPPTPRL
jgi:hypothetical protein